MIRKVFYVVTFLSLVLTGYCITVFPRSCGAQNREDSLKNFTREEWAVFRREHQTVLERALEAYNKEDYEGFIKNFSGRRRKISETAFRALWIQGYKAEYGDYVSKEFFPERSNPSRHYPLLTYKTEFSENSKTGIRCIFAEDEDGEYRIFYLRIDPYEDLFY